MNYDAPPLSARVRLALLDIYGHRDVPFAGTQWYWAYDAFGGDAFKARLLADWCQEQGGELAALGERLARALDAEVPLP